MNRQSILVPVHKENLVNKKGRSVLWTVLTHVNKGKKYPYHSRTKAERKPLASQL